MGDPDTNRRTAVWASPARWELARAVCEAAGLSPVAAGSPERGRSAEFAGLLGAPSTFDDARAELASTDADLFMLIDAAGFADHEEPGDAEALRRASERGVKLLSLAPIPASAIELTSGGWSKRHHGSCALDLVRLGLLPTRSAAWRAATDLREASGAPKLLAVSVGTGEAGFGPGLLAALDLCHGLLGEPETVTAATVGNSAPTRASRRSMRASHAGLSALLRYPSGAAATITVDDQSPAWAWRASATADARHLVIADDHVEMHAPEAPDPDRVEFARDPGAANQAADSVRRLLDPAAPDEGPLPLESLLCTADAALLSATTGEAASPATIRRMVNPGAAPLW